jgi:hypothetical protein
VKIDQTEIGGHPVKMLRDIFRKDLDAVTSVEAAKPFTASSSPNALADVARLRPRVGSAALQPWQLRCGSSRGTAKRAWRLVGQLCRAVARSRMHQDGRGASVVLGSSRVAARSDYPEGIKNNNVYNKLSAAKLW